MKVEEIYLQMSYYNPVSKATITGAWIAVLEGGVEIPVAADYEGKDAAIRSAKRKGFSI